MKVFQSKTFWGITLLLILLKSLVGALNFDYVDNKLDYGSARFKTDFSRQISDETEFIRSAVYLIQTDSIKTDRPVYLTSIEKEPRIYLTALRPKAYIYFHSFGLKVYGHWKKVRVDEVGAFDLYDYMHWYHVLLFLIKTILFPVSVLFFFRTLRLFDLSPSLQQWGTWLYILIPSVFIFIGYLDLWENTALYCFIIVFYHILKEVQQERIRRSSFLLVPVLLAVSVLFRPQLLLTYVALLGFAVLFMGIRALRSKGRFGILSLLCGLTLVAVHIPILIQNHHYFGKYILSTQSQFEFYQGHNQFSRGSWNMNLPAQYPAYFDSVISVNRLQTASEYEEAMVYQDIASSWLRQHPKEELVLTARKIGGYLLPFNFMNHRLNIYTLLLTLAFIVYTFRFLFRTVWRRQWHQAPAEILLLLPGLMSVGLTILFFVGERWKFYAEPYFLIMLLLLVDGRMKQKAKV